MISASSGSRTAWGWRQLGLVMGFALLFVTSGIVFGQYLKTTRPTAEQIATHRAQIERVQADLRKGDLFRALVVYQDGSTTRYGFVARTMNDTLDLRFIDTRGPAQIFVPFANNQANDLGRIQRIVRLTQPAEYQELLHKVFPFGEKQEIYW